jgi:hypothetical protein
MQVLAFVTVSLLMLSAVLMAGMVAYGAANDLLCESEFREQLAASFAVAVSLGAFALLISVAV